MAVEGLYLQGVCRGDRPRDQGLTACFTSGEIVPPRAESFPWSAVDGRRVGNQRDLLPDTLSAQIRPETEGLGHGVCLLLFFVGLCSR